MKLLVFNLHFQFPVYKTELTGKPSAPFERAYNSGAETTLIFYIYFVFVYDLSL
jgi:hypothetical protein